MHKASSAYEYRDGLPLEMIREASTSLAFATVKIDGNCDPELGRLSLRGLAELQDAQLRKRMGWSASEEQLAVAKIIEAKLASLLELNEL